MTIRVTLSTGKVVELTPDERDELLDALGARRRSLTVTAPPGGWAIGPWDAWESPPPAPKVERAEY